MIATGAEGSLGANPSGIGAAYVESPQFDVDSVQKNLETINSGVEEQQKRQQKGIADGYKLLQDLEPDVKGIFDKDVPYFQNRLQDFHNEVKNLMSQNLPVNSLAYRQALNKITQKSKDIEAEVQGSVNDKQLNVDVLNHVLTHPDKFQTDKGIDYLKDWGSKPPPIRSQMNIGDALVPVFPNVLSQIDNKIAKLKSTEKLKGDVRLPTGRYATVYEKGVEPDEVDAITNEVYSDPANAKANKQLWDDATPADKAAYNLSAEVETQKNKQRGINSVGDPIKYMLHDQAQKRAGPKEVEYKNVQFDPTIVAQGKYQVEHPSDDYTWKKRYGLTTGDPRFYDTELPPTLVMPYPLNPVANLTTSTGKDYYSDFDHGTLVGAFAMDVPKVEQGQVVTDASGQPVMTKVMGIPNTIIAHRTFNGKPYIQKTENQYNYAKAVKKDLNDISQQELLNNIGAWEPETNSTPRQIINAKTDKEKDELRKQHNEFVDRQNAFTQTGDVDNYKASGISRKQQEQMPKYFTPDGKEVIVDGYSDEQIKKALSQGKIIKK